VAVRGIPSRTSKPREPCQLTVAPGSGRNAPTATATGGAMVGTSVTHVHPRVGSNLIDPIEVQCSALQLALFRSHLRPHLSTVHCLRLRPCRMPSNKRQHTKTPSPKKRSTKRTRQTRSTTKEVHLPGGALQTSFPVIPQVPVDGM
jgi:hypothetical protein